MTAACAYRDCKSDRGIRDRSLVPGTVLPLCSVHAHRFELMHLGRRIAADAQFTHLFLALRCDGKRRSPWTALPPDTASDPSKEADPQ